MLNLTSSLSLLRCVYYAVLLVCWLIGSTATAFATQIIAGVAMMAVWLARVAVESQFEGGR